MVRRLEDCFPESSHVAYHGLDDADDFVIWSFAQANGFTIVTKDLDFNDLSALRGAPPKIIWIRIGNCTTNTVEQVVRTYATAIEQFVTLSSDSLLEIIPQPQK
ncbi:hypothetical protein OSCT_2374 [Oscillochloris trichoides DG-6]|uniref:DUF5615 domain-containing protein n=1 Tax=Oscillochloris trichoides DG-6 TaxID=765420 RepID=E1IGC3_9CHLR|nr:hypothetical protein OSCT_2374 [Oscillochloris trichoides DG-6]